ncbi:AcrR family transcriptional regulator [Prauserella sediminis]|uniref:AcrR family transcriptional regulator n=1 Tax=Prauserella sediminis TaxID=577680 RepID=A0A839XRG8_9PSEU|nr:TetR family transcriptional regulator [Prauserella sediminis]MBB3664589.1 AcrR family transcriptional regulator [Prauserella sediminis]
MSESLRDRQKAQIRGDIQRAAVRLFAERGFDAVTTEEIAAAAGIGHSTYFRYVTSKDDLLLGILRRAGAAIVDNLQARPRGESAEEALCQASLRWSRAFIAEEEALGNWRAAIRGAPHVLDRVAVVGAFERAQLTKLLGDRMGARPDEDIRPGLLVHTVLAAAEFALLRWLDTDDPRGPTLHQLTEQALEGARTQCWK